jgi:hypothetical protein
MRIPNSFYYTRWFRYWMTYQRFLNIYRAFAQVEDLDNLVIWAKRKRLSYLVKIYRSKHLDAEIYLSRLRTSDPRLAKWARIIRYINSQIFPQKIYKKGYASHYRLTS